MTSMNREAVIAARWQVKPSARRIKSADAVVGRRRIRGTPGSGRWSSRWRVGTQKPGYLVGYLDLVADRRIEAENEVKHCPAHCRPADHTRNAHELLNDKDRCQGEPSDQDHPGPGDHLP